MTQPADGTLISARETGRRFLSGSQMVDALRDVSMDLFPGELVAVIGRSGSGKTTLLNLLGGLDSPTTGTVYFEGRDMASLSGGELTHLRRHKLGFIFQSFGLLPLLSAQENVELPLRISDVPRQLREERTRQALDTVGLLHRMKHRPYELSGGEQQRVAIARAIVHKPPLILADEPTAELDSATAKTIFSLLAQVVLRDRVTVVVATHDRTVLDVAQRVLELRDGTLVGGR